MSTDYLKQQIEMVKDDVAQACQKIGKPSEYVTLLGVTKTYEPEIINASIDFGITDIAENRVQEILRKYDAVNKNVRWHLIGHLQTNKVKYIVDKVYLIHSVDSVKLAEEINNRAKKIDKIQKILIQVNVADETQKFGVSPDALEEMLEAISHMENVKVCGLMNIAPLVEDPEVLRTDFKIMNDLFVRLKNCAYTNVEATFLSMGMSNDYEVAIEEGANMIRIGTKIYGKRNYS